MLFLALMHLAIALITYTLLVHVAPVREPGRQRQQAEATRDYSGWHG